MACITHTCLDCGKQWYSNSTRGDCPSCSGNNVIRTFDEVQEPNQPVAMPLSAIEEGDCEGETL